MSNIWFYKLVDSTVRESFTKCFWYFKQLKDVFFQNLFACLFLTTVSLVWAQRYTGILNFFTLTIFSLLELMSHGYERNTLRNRFYWNAKLGIFNRFKSRFLMFQFFNKIMTFSHNRSTQCTVGCEKRKRKTKTMPQTLLCISSEKKKLISICLGNNTVVI